MRHFICFFLLAISLSFPVLAQEKQSAFERIMQTGVIRCGYYVFPPVTYRDPNTDELSGFSVDMMNEIGRRADLEIEWTEEIGFGNWVSPLQTGRFDVACTPMWPDVPQGRAVAFSIPMFYAGLYPMVRTDDARFKDDDLDSLNDEAVTFALAEGNAQESLVKAHFPKAKTMTVPPGNDKASFVMNVLSKKADVFLTDHNGKIEFNRYNDGQLRLMAVHDPVKLQPFNLAVERNEMVLKDFIDNAILDLLYDGSIDRMLTEWEPEPGITYLRAEVPYRKD